MEELEANLYQYNEVDAELLSSQHDFQDGTITQQQYNSVVQAYEQLLKGLDEEIDQQKAKLAEDIIEGKETAEHYLIREEIIDLLSEKDK